MEYKGGQPMERIIDVAQYVIDYYALITRNCIDEMKLHKLLYFIQRECYAITRNFMFTDDFEGWIHGPVSVEVRSSFIEFEKKVCLNKKTKRIREENAYIVRNVVEEYGRYDSWFLRNLSHEEISWINSRKGLSANDPGNVIMKKQDIAEDSKKVRPFDSQWGMYYDEFDDLEEYE